MTKIYTSENRKGRGLMRSHICEENADGSRDRRHKYRGVLIFSSRPSLKFMLWSEVHVYIRGRAYRHGGVGRCEKEGEIRQKKGWVSKPERGVGGNIVIYVWKNAGRETEERWKSSLNGRHPVVRGSFRPGRHAVTGGGLSVRGRKEEWEGCRTETMTSIPNPCFSFFHLLTSHPSLSLSLSCSSSHMRTLALFFISPVSPPAGCH